jgi:hypothetical protein
MCSLLDKEQTWGPAFPVEMFNFYKLCNFASRHHFSCLGELKKVLKPFRPRKFLSIINTNCICGVLWIHDFQISEVVWKNACIDI